MRTKLLGYLSAILLLSITSCDESTDTSEYGNWVKQSDFEGVTRSGAISFSIGNYAYVGLGSDGDDYLTDFWRFDPSKTSGRRWLLFPVWGGCPPCLLAWTVKATWAPDTMMIWTKKN